KKNLSTFSLAAPLDPHEALLSDAEAARTEPINGAHAAVFTFDLDAESCERKDAIGLISGEKAPVYQIFDAGFIAAGRRRASLTGRDDGVVIAHLSIVDEALSERSRAGLSED